MHDVDLFQQALGLEQPWEVVEVSSNGKPGGKVARAPMATSSAMMFSLHSPTMGRGADIAAVATCDYTTYLDDSLVVDNGPSFAAPAVSGAAALLLAREPWLTPAAVKLLIQRPLSAMGR